MSVDAIVTHVCQVECNRALVPVTAFAPASCQVGIVLAHGAGGDMDSGHLPTTAARLADMGYAVVRYTYKTINLKSRVQVMKAVLREVSALPVLQRVEAWVLAGHSMGARVAASVAAEVEAGQDVVPVAGCLMFSFPVHPPGKPDQRRDDPLCSLKLPLMFVRGSNDPFSSAGAFQDVQSRMSSSSLQVHLMEGGDHSLKVKGGQGKCEEAMDGAYSAIGAFLSSLDRSPPTTSAPTGGLGAAEHGTAAGSSAWSSGRSKKARGAASKKREAGSQRKGKASTGGGANNTKSERPTRAKMRTRR